MEAIREKCPEVRNLTIAGSVRRMEETVGDIDMLCTADDPRAVLDSLVAMPNVVDVLGHGDTKASVYLSDGIQIDLRVVEGTHFGALLQYFSGNLQHNIQLRDRANDLGLSLNEYGLTNKETDELEVFADEEGIYQRLGMQYIPPELRQGVWEVQAARENRIPTLVEISDIRGDLHDHTDWSDGRDPMETMILSAKERGLEYLAITDHSVGRGIANGLSTDRLENHKKLVRELDESIGGIKLFTGTEMDIRADGSLDYSDDVLEQLDWVVASVHSAMGQDSETMTDRIIKAMHNPHVDVIGHLTTRLVGERQPIEADFEAIFKAAAETGTALEINASPERMDLRDAHVYRARELGVALVISTDAHTTEGLSNTRYGVGIARRGWCEARHILNTLPLDDFLEYLALNKTERTEAFARLA
ncbi:MAG: PHP domain-containing protein [Chloroflexi bacterium]|nr:PHP domain-containing protein [Chloroflexota bacterium]